MARFELALEEARGEPWGHGERFVILAGGQSRCKGPGAGMCLVSSEDSRRSEWVERRGSGPEWGQVDRRPCRSQEELGRGQAVSGGEMGVRPSGKRT